MRDAALVIESSSPPCNREKETIELATCGPLLLLSAFSRRLRRPLDAPPPLPSTASTLCSELEVTYSNVETGRVGSNADDGTALRTSNGKVTAASCSIPAGTRTGCDTRASGVANASAVTFRLGLRNARVPFCPGVAAAARCVTEDCSCAVVVGARPPPLAGCVSSRVDTNVVTD